MRIERFIARRGTPSVICSDNGTNFVGAETELLSCIQSWNNQAPSELAKRVLSGNLTTGSPASLGNVSFGVVKGILRNNRK